MAYRYPLMDQVADWLHDCPYQLLALCCLQVKMWHHCTCRCPDSLKDVITHLLSLFTTSTFPTYLGWVLKLQCQLPCLLLLCIAASTHSVKKLGTFLADLCGLFEENGHTNDSQIKALLSETVLLKFFLRGWPRAWDSAECFNFFSTLLISCRKCVT